jgi:hypothetical protein
MSRMALSTDASAGLPGEITKATLTGSDIVVGDRRPSSNSLVRFSTPVKMPSVAIPPIEQHRNNQARSADHVLNAHKRQDPTRPPAGCWSRPGIHI